MNAATSSMDGGAGTSSCSFDREDFLAEGDDEAEDFFSSAFFDGPRFVDVLFFDAPESPVRVSRVAAGASSVRGDATPVSVFLDEALDTFFAALPLPFVVASVSDAGRFAAFDAAGRFDGSALDDAAAVASDFFASDFFAAAAGALAALCLRPAVEVFDAVLRAVRVDGEALFAFGCASEPFGSCERGSSIMDCVLLTVRRTRMRHGMSSPPTRFSR